MSDPKPSFTDLQRIISQQEASRLRGVSIATLRREVARTNWPPRIQLSERRIGHRLGDVLREKPGA